MFDCALILHSVLKKCASIVCLKDIKLCFPSFYFIDQKVYKILLFFQYYGCLICKLIIKLLSSNYDKRMSADLPGEKVFSKHIFMLFHLGEVEILFYKF